MFLWNIAVTSLVEVWIEIQEHSTQGKMLEVTSLVEVWIEIYSRINRLISATVTSLVEVWIEIIISGNSVVIHSRHFPCGSVD